MQAMNWLRSAFPKRSIFQAIVVLALTAVTLAFPEHFGNGEALAAAPIMFTGNVLDVFNGNAFNVTSLTDAINKIPFVPGRLGQLIPWGERGVTTTAIMLEEKAGVLTLVNPSPRGGVGSVIDKQKRVARTLTIPHYQRDDAIYADEVQGVREFGQEQTVATVQGIVSGRMADHTSDFDATLEYQRIGAVKGTILNADGSTLYNLFTEFGVSQEAEIDFDLDNASPGSGALRKACAGAVRLIANNLGGSPFAGVHAICGDTFFDQLIAHSEVRASYLSTEMARVLRDGYVYPNSNVKIFGAFEFGGIVWENYRGSYDGTNPMVAATKAHLFPMGANLFRTVYAPADYIETVNTIGLPRYAKQYRFPNDKGVALEMQMNALSYCVRPKALLVLRNT